MKKLTRWDVVCSVDTALTSLLTYYLATHVFARLGDQPAVFLGKSGSDRDLTDCRPQ
jgi:hypothetical protein